MTISGEYSSPSSKAVGGTPPELPFGMTPLLAGVVCGLLGLGVAVLLWTSFVGPDRDRYEQLKTDVETLKQQITAEQARAQEKGAAQSDLEAARQQRSAVESLFATSEALDTLLLDIQDLAVANQVKLTTYEPDLSKSGTLTDGSLGAGVDGKLKRKAIKVIAEAEYNQLLSFLRGIERLQPLLLISDVDIQIPNDSPVMVRVSASGTVLPGDSGHELTASMVLQAITPLTPEEVAASQPQPGQPPGSQPGQAQN
jgi:Tfp pilus assembly protein PilO